MLLGKESEKSEALAHNRHSVLIVKSGGEVEGDDEKSCDSSA